jgi:nitroreductase
MHDTGAANTTLLLQAAELDIYGHMLGGFDMQKTISEFSIDDDWEVACFIALGYLGSPDNLEEPFKTREITPRTRKPQQDIVSRLI